MPPVKRKTTRLSRPSPFAYPGRTLAGATVPGDRKMTTRAMSTYMATRTTSTAQNEGIVPKHPAQEEDSDQDDAYKDERDDDDNEDDEVDAKKVYQEAKALAGGEEHDEEYEVDEGDGNFTIGTIANVATKPENLKLMREANAKVLKQVKELPKFKDNTTRLQARRTTVIKRAGISADTPGLHDAESDEDSIKKEDSRVVESTQCHNANYYKELSAQKGIKGNQRVLSDQKMKDFGFDPECPCDVCRGMGGSHEKIKAQPRAECSDRAMVT